MSMFYSLLVSTGFKSLFVLGAAGVAAILLRRSSAAVRHIVWTAAFAGLLALPALTVSVPALPVVAMPQRLVFQAQTGRSPTVAARNQATGIPVHRGGAGVPRQQLPWRESVAWLWIGGCAFSLAQMAVAWLVMLRVHRRSRPFPGLQLDGVSICEARCGSMPMTFGLFRPTIFLPADAAQWPEDRRRAVLLHELAHVRRGDPAMHLLARAALALYWWNPLAWFAWRQFVRERERAADDLVLNAGARPSSYAGHLLEIARELHVTPAIGCAAVAMACRSQLEGRLVAILDSRVNRKPPRRAAWIAAVATILLITPLAALRAQDSATIPADVDATIRAAAAQKNHEMLESAALAEGAYRKFDLARKLLDSSLAIRGEVSGQQSVDYGVGLIKIGDLELSRHNLEEAQNFYAKAVSVLGNQPQATPALIHLGLLALEKKDNQKAYNSFQQAQVADPSKTGPALMWMAIVRDRQGDTAGADSLFKQSFSAEYMGSYDAATTLEAHAAFLRRQGREDEAKALSEHAATIRRELSKNATEFRQVAGVTPLRVGAGVTAPALTYKIEPDYSEEARAARVEGTVVVATTIGTDGTAQNMKVIKALGLGLDEQALQAISQWRFKPGTKDGQPVSVMATIEVNFRLL